MDQKRLSELRRTLGNDVHTALALDFIENKAPSFVDLWKLAIGIFKEVSFALG
jgi:hypothetical protein